MDNAISIRNLNKIYSSNKPYALKDINLDIKRNTIFGLLGPNGAGKSTLINILAGLTKKTSGSINVLGQDFDLDNTKIKYLLGVVPQEIALDNFFDVRNALEFHAGYFGIRPEMRKTEQIMQALNLADKAKSTPRMLSGGMKRRLLIAKAMVASPPILILDEPTAGVDIELRGHLWDYVLKLKEAGTTIILTTHYLAEAEKLCDEIAFINKGAIIHVDKKDNLLNTLGSKKMIIECSNIDERMLQNYPEISVIDGGLMITFDGKETINHILQHIISLGVEIRDIKIERDDLESIYKKYITHNLG
jgi:ABC-2 type transport system ATP-binding protein